MGKFLKSLTEINSTAKWLILLVGSGLITLVSIFALFEFLFDIEFLGSHRLTPIIGFVVSILLALYCMRFITLLFSKRMHRQYFDKFNHNDSTGHFVETNAQYYSPKKVIKHAVLLLHGFTTSPQDFGDLLTKLKADEITYVAPVLPGFGTKNLKMLENISYQDWCRHAIEEYQRLSQYAEKITVVGQSMGSLLACFIAKHYEVENLVLSAPAFFIKKEGEQRFVRLIENKVFSRVISACLPMIPKTAEKYKDNVTGALDEKSLEGYFNYLTVPTSAIREILRFQTASRDLSGLKFKHLYLIMGEQDTIIDTNPSLKLFNDQGYRYEIFNLQNTAHQPWRDDDSHHIVSWLINKIKSPHLSVVDTPESEALS